MEPGAGAAPAALEQHGFALLPSVLDDHACDAMAGHLARASVARAGSRTLLSQPWCQTLAQRLSCHAALAALLPPGLVAVQCTSFEKSATRNWLVPLHQDLGIAVAQRVEHPQLQGWSRKEGVLHVQVPAEVLERLVAVRLHLDACTAADGPLRVIPGSHRHGTLDAHAITAWRPHAAEVVCAAPRGSALLMRPLLLHASSKASGTSRRRVLHFVFGPRDLPFGLRWA